MENTTGELRKKAHDLKDSAIHKMDGLDRKSMDNTYRDLQGTLRAGFDEVSSSVKEGVEASEDFVKSYPLYSILGAAAVGFLAGAIINRRH